MTGAGLDAYDEARVGIGTWLLIGFAGLIAALFVGASIPAAFLLGDALAS